MNALAHIISWYYISRKLNMKSYYSIGPGASRQSYRKLIESIEEIIFESTADQNNNANEKNNSVDSADEGSVEDHSTEDSAISTYTRLVS